MQAFHNENDIKEKYLKRVENHILADKLVKGATGENGKGCAVACTLDMDYDHSKYETELGIPEWVARLEDSLFEGMSDKKSENWPADFLEAIPVGFNEWEKERNPSGIYVRRRSILKHETYVETPSGKCYKFIWNILEEELDVPAQADLIEIKNMSKPEIAIDPQIFSEEFLDAAAEDALDELQREGVI